MERELLRSSSHRGSFPSTPVGVLDSSALTGADAALSFEAAKHRAVKQGQTFLKLLQSLLFPLPTPAASQCLPDFPDALHCIARSV
ncbi:unnamed protein product [Closterium sp. Yama58-4]|nr:unnamed protein product [Closterium sp. Yama58-4]